jgi:transposase
MASTTTPTPTPTAAAPGGKRLEGRARARPPTRPPYAPAFRAEAVQLVRTRVASLARIARDLGVSQDTLRAWVKRADIDAGRREGLIMAERAELAQLRRENRLLRMERDLLKKATVFFARGAKEGDTIR